MVTGGEKERRKRVKTPKEFSCDAIPSARFAAERANPGAEEVESLIGRHSLNFKREPLEEGLPFKI